MLRPRAHHLRRVGLAVVALALFAAVVLAMQLRRGPVPLGAARPAVEAWLSHAVDGGRARVGGAELAWFPRARALGLRLSDVSLIDRRGRPVLQARHADAGLSMASLVAFRPAPGRLAADDFFAALSVSPQGQLALGYEASGAPKGGGDSLAGLFADVTGAPRRGHPLSFLRELDLQRGIIAFRQTGGPVSWRGRIDLAQLHKTDGRLDSRLQLAVGSAALQLYAGGEIGLKRAEVRVAARDLDPARLFPTAGPLRTLSVLDAPVQGQGTLSWAADRGLRAADVSLEAGAGEVRTGGAEQPFQKAQLRAVYDPASGRVMLRTGRLQMGGADLDLAGQGWLTPERRHVPARFELVLTSAASRLALAPGAPLQRIEAFQLRAGYAPKLHRFDLDGATANVDGVPLSASGYLQRSERKGWGAEFQARLDGWLAPRQITALWPGAADADTRSWVDGHVQSGRFGQARFHLKLAPGESLDGRHRDRIQLAFNFQDGAALADEHLPLLEAASGSGLLQGDRFDLWVARARMQAVELSDGLVEVPRLAGEGKRLEVEGHAIGEAGDILRVVDRATAGEPSRHGVPPARLAGRGDVIIHLGRNLGDKDDDFRVVYEGSVAQAVLQQAALGMTLRSDRLQLAGTLDRFDAKGDVSLGPYRGPLTFAAAFPAGRPSVQKAVFDGVLDAASAGSSPSRLPFQAHFDSRGAEGHGVIRSRAFQGETSWSFGGQGRFSGHGVVDVAALRAAGLPVGKGLPDKIPARLTLKEGPGGWSGALQADAYSGSLSMPAGPTFRARYEAPLTAAAAARIGLEARPTNLVLDFAGGEASGAVSYAAGPWLGQVSWQQAPGATPQYRWRTTLTPADLHQLGMPAGIEPRISVPIDLVLSPAANGWSGAGTAAGASFRLQSDGPAGAWRKLTVSAAVEGATLADLGLTPQGMIAGPAAVTADLEMTPQGVRAGRLAMDLQKAAVDAPFVGWRKPAGRPMQLIAALSRTADGALEASSIRGGGQGFMLSASGLWRPGGDGVVHVASAELAGAFEGALDFSTGPQGRKLAVRARFLDARPLLEGGGRQGLQTDPAIGAGAAGAPLRIDARFDQVRMSGEGAVRNVRIDGVWGGGDRRRLEVQVLRDDGRGLVDLKLFPDAAGMAIRGEVADVGETALEVFGRQSFRGGRATVNGRLAPGGADLHVEMRKVRLVKAPAMARILTVGSLHGMADLLNGEGIEFNEVVAPVSVRGSRLIIGQARATGPAMGVATQGVIDVDSGTVDLSGSVAPSYVLNSALGAAPVIGKLLVSRKGEGMFAVSYAAKGSFSAPKISVNPLSIAAPGILRRMFETHAARTKLGPEG